jgi:hypothetical protein
MKPDGSLLCSQDPTAGPCLELAESSPHPQTLFKMSINYMLRKMYFHVFNFWTFIKCERYWMCEGNVDSEFIIQGIQKIPQDWIVCFESIFS